MSILQDTNAGQQCNKKRGANLLAGRRQGRRFGRYWSLVWLLLSVGRVIDLVTGLHAGLT